MFQINSKVLLIGTKKGQIEVWEYVDDIKESYEDIKNIRTINALPESEEGISSIIEVKSEDPLIRGSLKAG